MAWLLGRKESVLPKDASKTTLEEVIAAKTPPCKKGSKLGADRLKALYPFSFFAREKVFRTSKKVLERDQGFCRVKRGFFGRWRKFYISLQGNQLICCQRGNGNVRHSNMQTVHAIKLVAAKLWVSGPTRFCLREVKGPKFTFESPSLEQMDEWLMKFQQTPGMYRRVEDFYDVMDVLGEGATCRVHECVSRITGKRFALKTRVDPSDELGRHGMYNELRILQIMDKNKHPAIPRLEDFFFDQQGDIKLVQELMEGGELLNRIAKKEYFSEQEARCFFKSIAEGVQHLHENGIAHRDLKPSNIMLLDDTDQPHIKIIDYDLAKENYAQTWYGHTPCGTTDYMAPEIVQKRQYTQAIDIWSLGCVLYLMLCGDVPFQGDTAQEIKERIVEGRVGFGGHIWGKISGNAKMLVKGMLEKDSKKRLTAAQVLSHPWMLEEEVSRTRLSVPDHLSRSLSSNSLDKLAQFQKEVLMSDMGTGPSGLQKSVGTCKKQQNLGVLKSRLMQVNYMHCDPHASRCGGPSSAHGSENDHTVVEKKMFIKAYGSAPDLQDLSLLRPIQD